MSFATDLVTLMNADTSLNALVSSVNFIHAQDNKSLTAEYIVYNYDKTDDISSFDAYEEMTIYRIDVAVFAGDTVSMDNITEAVRTYLDNYETTPFLDVRFVGDERGTDLEKEQYNAILEYRIIYKN